MPAAPVKFLLDQSSDARLLAFLTQLGHDVRRIGREYPPGLRDREVLAIAHREGRILITDDRDFGELVFRLGQPHSGVVHLRFGRLDNYAPLATKLERLQYVLSHYADQLDQFLVVTRHRVRVRRAG